MFTEFVQALCQGYSPNVTALSLISLTIYTVITTLCSVLIYKLISKIL